MFIFLECWKIWQQEVSWVEFEICYGPVYLLEKKTMNWLSFPENQPKLEAKPDLF